MQQCEEVRMVAVENSPKLSGEDDMYELFMVAIERGTQF